MSFNNLFQRSLGVAAVTLALAAGANAQTIGCEIGVSNGGLVPASGTGNGTYPTVAPSFPMITPLNVASVPAGATHVTAVKLVGATHTYVGDVQWILQDPAGNKYNIFNRQGGGCDYGGDYTFVPPCTGGTALVTPCAGPIASGSYDQNFGTWPNGNLGISNTVMSNIPAATGTWNLIGYDWAGGDTGAITSWDICFGTPPVPAAPPAALPTLTAPANAATVTGPFVNLTWNAVACATGWHGRAHLARSGEERGRCGHVLGHAHVHRFRHGRSGPDGSGERRQRQRPRRHPHLGRGRRRDELRHRRRRHGLQLDGQQLRLHLGRRHAHLEGARQLVDDPARRHLLGLAHVQ
jgi:hypothetical protein